MSSKYRSRSAVSISHMPEPRFEADPSRQSIALERIGDEIAELSRDLQATEYRFLCLIREFDEGGGWVYQGARSCAQWLSWRTGLDSGAAREKVRVARALGNLPRISEALSRGVISYSKVRAITRVATLENEETLLQIALQATASQVERMVRAWRKANPSEERGTATFRRKARPFSMRQDEDGMWVVRGRLTPEVGAVLMKALRAAGAPSFEEEPEGGVSAETSSPARTPGQKQEEALRLLAESALAGGLDLVRSMEATLPGDGSPSGQSVVEPSAHVSAETCRPIAGDASVVEMKHDENGKVLDTGWKRRFLPSQRYWSERNEPKKEDLSPLHGARSGPDSHGGLDGSA